MSRAMGLRNSVRGEKAAKRNGWKGGWKDRIDLPKAEATPVLFTRGDYEDIRTAEIKKNEGEPPVKHYHVHRMHGVKIGDSYRSFRCAASYDDTHPANTCMACRSYEERDKRLSTKDQFSLNLLHLALYQRSEVKDKQGAVKKYEQDSDKHKRGEVIKDWKEVTAARDLKLIRANIDEMIAKGDIKTYAKKYAQVGAGHLENIMGIDEMASKHCRCGGTLQPVAFSCGGCEEVLADLEAENMEREEVQRFDAEKHRCKKCDFYGYADKVVLCNECEDPRPLSIFEVVAFVRKAGEGTSSTITCEKIVPLTEFTLADDTYLLKIDSDNAFVPDKDGVFQFREDIAKATTQFDFESVYVPADNEFICRTLSCVNTIDGGGGPRKYGRQAPVEDDADAPAPPRPGMKKPGPAIRN